ncbi:MAG: SpoVR family protein [Bacteroidetes bacterium]|nr:SpoVR family protein [Bacteroidota bacterium]MBU1117144.1 SpoVR family protein [Bacteroidota bacterium]MBU1800308.1 SpoVR family protein [Bacteroidota bacterium]
MILIDQHTKQIMEGCKVRAFDAGLRFGNETLEYIVTNSDLIELSPKHMIPTLYDYWLQDIQVLRGKGEYDIYPNNPFETVINTRPAISFYNDNNPDWLNVMIFYHVLAHIDFFQNNKFFSKTWDYDFKEKALTEKRIVARLRSQHGREVDYVIEFARGIDNLIGYFSDLDNTEDYQLLNLPSKVDYYFNTFLQAEKTVSMKFFLEEVEKYNSISANSPEEKDEIFFSKIVKKHPEFDAFYKKGKFVMASKNKPDLLQFIMRESKVLNEENNMWKQSIIEIVRDTSLYFSPQIRTKTMNEGWASYWHEKLFMLDDRIKGHEIAFARINAKVTSINHIGLNPYAIGWRLFMQIKEMADQEKYSYAYNKIMDIEDRKKFDNGSNLGNDFIFHVRENYCDSTFLNRFIDQDFVDKYKLMVVGQRINTVKNVKEYYVKSRKASEYKKMMMESLYHPPFIKFEKDENGALKLYHLFEGKELYRDYIKNTLIGLEYLWGNEVILETTEIDWEEIKKQKSEKLEPKYQKVLYRVKNKKVTKQKLT